MIRINEKEGLNTALLSFSLKLFNARIVAKESFFLKREDGLHSGVCKTVLTTSKSQFVNN